ncbi:MAG: hypothetical protein WC587_03310 [Candidatus Paceibacterota bacterium]
MIKLDFKKITRYFIYSDDRFASLKPWRDWKIMIVGLLIFLAAAIIIDGYIFWEFKFGSPFGVNNDFASETKILVLKKQSLERIVKELEGREKMFNDVFSTSTPLVKDPSL